MRMHFPSSRMAQNARFFMFQGRLSVVVLSPRGFCVRSVFFFFGGWGVGKPPRQTLLKYENKIAKVNLGAAVLKKSLCESSHGPSLGQQGSGRSHQGKAV